METIVKLAKKYNTDKKMVDGTPAINNLKGHNYAVVYDELLKDKQINSLLEIGVSYGSSIKMWAEYFDYKCNITGIDISTKRFDIIKLNNIPYVNIVIGDATKKNVIDNLGKFDVIIDDGSHKDLDQISSLYHLWSHLNTGGMYIIEDLHVSNKNNPVSSYNILKRLNCNFYSNDKLAVLWK